ncbi:MAG: RDD family protein [Pirellulales bacterium]|nr:RDD family protein [Pirellulales bacterium]
MFATAEGVVFQFRCSRCYSALAATSDRVGHPYVCPACGDDRQVVPEATDARIAAAQASQAWEVGRQSPCAAGPRAEGSGSPGGEIAATYRQFRDEFGITASPLVRLVAKIVDNVCLAAAAAAGVIAAVLFAPSPPIHSYQPPDPVATVIFLAVAALPTLALLIGQWAWTANEGKTIGKKLLGIRVANQRGEGTPGFVSGVLLRSWINFVLGSVVPFYSAADVAFIFRDNRCLHDRLAGTIVLEGNVLRGASSIRQGSCRENLTAEARSV